MSSLSRTAAPLFALLVALAACGGPEDQAAALGRAASPTAAADDQALTANADTRPGVIPPLVEWRKWNHDKRLVPSFRVASHFVNQVSASPDDPTHFRAYGVDSVTRVVYYNIDGVIKRDLKDFLLEVDLDIVHNGLAAQGLGLEYTWGSTGQIIIRAPPDPNPPQPGGRPEAAISRLEGLAQDVQRAIAVSLEAVVR